MIATGTIIGGYHVDGLIGQGGMGVVYEATQLSLSRKIALKVLSAAVSSDPTFRERFRREGLLQAALDHPHIIPVYEAGESDAGLFLAMRFVRGPNLREVIVAGQLDPRRALALLGQVAGALDAAHEAGMIHRDIKPQNILVGPRDHAYLADFGITKGLEHEGLTQTGQLVGTLDYVSPEQVLGRQPTLRSDIYSLGAVVYEAFTGRVPFPRDSNAALLYAHVSDPPPKVTATRPDLPTALDAVVQRALAKDPGARYPSAAALVADAAAALDARGNRAAETATAGAAPTVSGMATLPGTRARPTAGSAPAPAAPRRHRTRRVALAALGLAAVAGGLLLGRWAADGGERAAEPPVTQAVQTLAAGGLSAKAPGSWARVPNPPAIPGLELSQPVAASPAGGNGDTIVLGRAAAAGRTLLPASLRSRLPASPRPDRVRLGRLQAYRYRALRPSGLAGVVTVYAAPTAPRVATVACLARSTRDPFLGRCESVATSLAVAGGRVYGLGLPAAYRTALNARVDRLDGAIAASRGQLRGATRAGQLQAARSLGAAYLAAARGLGGLDPGPRARQAHEAVLDGLRSTADAYARLATAARSGDDAAFRHAGAAVGRDETALRTALARLQAIR